MNRKPRAITKEEKAYLLSLESSQLDFALFMELFSDTSKIVDKKMVKVHSKFDPGDTLTLEKGEYFNKERVDTTVGRFFYNKLIIEPELSEVVGYVNFALNSKGVGKVDDILSKALLLDKITVDTFVRYLNKTQNLSMMGHTIICGSYTMGILKPRPEMTRVRDKLLKENEEKLANGDLITAVNIEKEVLRVASEAIEGDPGMELFDSGARGSIGNNYKNISVIKGPVYNPLTGKFDISTSNLMEGIKKEEIHIYANALVTGAYPKAIGTATAGYFSKQIIAALQAVVADKPGSDCRTVLTVDQEITGYNKNDFLFRYIVEGGKLVILDDTTISKYVGKLVKLRSPMVCKGKAICSKCLGEMFYMLGIQNVGLTASRTASTILKMKMKQFHDATAKTHDISNIQLTLK